jgi:hypothetical protein
MCNPLGEAYGVMDHCFIEVSQGRKALYAENGDLDRNGNKAWSNPPFFGTSKFWFCEDNTWIRTGNAAGITDSSSGGRYVIRHNYIKNAILADHGTEGGAVRGARDKEIYSNTFDTGTTVRLPSGQRSGGALVHDNTAMGTIAPIGMHNFTTNRTGYLRATPVWGLSDGTSIWDANVTDVGPDQWDKTQQTFVEGHAPHLFESGAASQTTAEGTLVDNTKNWPADRFVGYSIRNTSSFCPRCRTPFVARGPYRPGPLRRRRSPQLASYIKSNTATTITYAVWGGNNHMIFNAGDSYTIHRVLIVLDAPARGQTDPINTVGNTPINTMTGTASYGHPRFEPVYGWNNVFINTNTQAQTPLLLRNNSGQPVCIENIDFFNLGNGIVGTPPQVSNFYNAANNGVQYTGPFTYPHPLVSGTQPPPSATGGPSNSSRKKSKEAKKKKRTPKKIGERHS